MSEIMKYTHSFSRLMDKLTERGISGNFKSAVYGAGLSATLLAQGAITLSPATTNYEGGGNRVPSNAFLQSDSDHSPALLSRQRLSSEFRDIPISVSSNGETVRLSLDQADVFLAGDSQNGIEGLTEQLEPKLISLLSKGEGVTLETAIPNLDPRYSARIALSHAAPAPYAERQAPAPSR